MRHPVRMTAHAFTHSGTRLFACPSGGLWWPDAGMLVVSDLHLGKSERMARRGGTLLPPYETQDTLARLEAELAAFAPRTVLCLGDTFDDQEAAECLPAEHADWLMRLQAGRHWIWIAGNHDPAPIWLPGTHLASHAEGPLTFRHTAEPGAVAEVSGHYHPKARLGMRGLARPCFLVDAARIILPAFGTYTGGLWCDAPVLTALMAPDARAFLTGTAVHPIPMPRGGQALSAGSRPRSARAGR